MPTSSWSTPTLRTVRQRNRDAIAAALGVAILPNGEVRVLADANAGNAHLDYQYLDWQANQLLPDTAEQRFLDKWANIYLINADGSRGRKLATFAAGTVSIVATVATTLPAGAILNSGTLAFQTTAAVLLGAGANVVPIRALDPGSAGNLDTGTSLSLAVAISGVSGSGGVSVGLLTGGADEETDDELRARVLQRIRQPPMGGDADDYVAWALEVAGVTRAWCSPLEMGIGTVTVRFMCDDLRASSGGLPTDDDVEAVRAYLDTVRPVAVKDFFVVKPNLTPISFAVQNLVGDSVSLRAAIQARVEAMLRARAAPASAVNGIAQPAVDIPAAWVDAAVYAAVGGVSYDLVMADAHMPNPGCLAVLGAIR